VHWLDRLFYLALPRQPFFAGGWGDDRVFEARALHRLPSTPPHRIEVTWEGETALRGARVRAGRFESPERLLPEVARRARFRLILPRKEPEAICIHLASSGDQGFAMRSRFAAPLLSRGIAALVLENAFYGRRRPPDQPGAAVRTVSDLLLMASATVLEGRALLAWLQEQGHRRLGVAGYSMGGQMSAMVAASVPVPLAVTAMAASNTPATVFTECLLSRHPRWEALARPGKTPAEARAALGRLLARYGVTSLPPPVEPRAAVVVANRQDGVVAPADMRRIAEHWGCELRWLDTGHVGAVVWHQNALRQAVADAFERLRSP
jgi:pimeloyl-ACP methyl ester carboxylesterase